VTQSRHYPDRKNDSGGNGGTIAFPSWTSARRPGRCISKVDFAFW
jgi:hypothetical protein